MSDDRLTEVADALELPEELAEAEIAGTETAGIDESLRLHGPPGTGKTTQIALRVGTLLGGEPDLSPAQMSVVTYRKSLASTVRRRLARWNAVEIPENANPNSADPENPFRSWNTIHAVAARATGFHDDIDNDIELSGMVSGGGNGTGQRDQRLAFCKEEGIQCYPRKPWHETRWTVFYDLYTYAKNNLLDVGQWKHIDGDDLRPLRSDDRAEDRLEAFHDEWGDAVEFAQVVHKWEAFKAEHDCHDFYELLEAALYGPVPPSRVVVIDEYHDATPLMAAVSERWIDAADTAIVAGDPDQVCNGYAGASPRFFEDLDEHVERDMPVVLLDHSWRNPAEHREAAARVLRQERAVPQVGTTGRGELLRHPTSQYHNDGGQWRHLPRHDEPGSPVRLWRQYGENIMFLARTQKQVDGIAAALDEAGIIYKTQDDAVAGESWATRLQLMSALEVLEGVSVDAEGVGQKTSIEDYGQTDDTNNAIENRALSVEETRTLLTHANRRYLDSERADWHLWLIEHEREAGDTVPLKLLTEHVTRKFWERYNAGQSSIGQLTRLSDRDTEAMRAAWDRYDTYTHDATTSETRVLTIHASKGSEASDVVVFDGITKSISTGLEEDADSRENEARTWYVALTRASKRVHIVRDAFEYLVPYLPEDLEPAAAKATQDKLAATDGGEPS